MEPEENQYELVMPFVAVKSEGGAFDDESFVAGAEFGAIDHNMRIAKAMDLRLPPRMVDPRLLAQIDLLAMRHGFRLETEDLGDLVGVTFLDERDDCTCDDPHPGA